MGRTQDSAISNKANGSNPIIVAVEMGYGHLRAAHAVAESFGTEVIRMDLPPVAGPGEAALWSGMRKFYNGLSQACDWPVTGTAAQAILEKITEISPLRPDTFYEPSNLLARLAYGLTGSVVGRQLRSIAAGKPLLATYPAAAMAAIHATPESRVFCLATDTDLNRAWAAPDPRKACIEYFAPVSRVVNRLRSFGVPQERIHLTGFPLPAKLIAESRSSLARRLHRLDPALSFRSQAGDQLSPFTQGSSPLLSAEPMRLTLAIGGAGGQIRHVSQILRSVRDQIWRGKLHLTLIAGTRADVAETLRKMAQAAGVSTENRNGADILFAPKPQSYFRLFEDCLADTDLLWTKPSELVFYAALGLPMLLAPPLGGQEHANRNWLLANEAALDAGDPAMLGQLLEDLLARGELCRIAWNGYSRLDRDGLNRIYGVLNSIS